jgi:hypothetical protein
LRNGLPHVNVGQYLDVAMYWNHNSVHIKKAVRSPDAIRLEIWRSILNDIGKVYAPQDNDTEFQLHPCFSEQFLDLEFEDDEEDIPPGEDEEMFEFDDVALSNDDNDLDWIPN